MSEPAFYLKKGASVPVPAPGDKAIILDTDNAIKSVDSNGTKATIGGAVNVDTTLTGDGSVATPLGISGWWAASQKFLQSKVATALEFVPYKPGLSTFNATDANVEGAGISPTGAAQNLISLDKVWQNPGAGKFAVMMRAKFTGAVSTNICSLGIAGSAAQVGITSNSGVDATHWYLNIVGAGTTNVTLSVADTGYHDFGITFDGTTITAWIDGVSVGSTTTLTNLPSVSCSPSIFNQVASQIIITKAIWGYVAP